MKVKHFATLYLTSSQVTVLQAVEGDGARVLMASLMEGADPWTVPEGTSIGIGYTLPDKTEGYYDRLEDGSPAAMIAGNLVTAVLAPVLTAQAGTVKLSLILRQGERQIATFPLHLLVAKRPGRIGAEEIPPVSAYEGLLLYGGPGGEVLPLKLGPGLSIRDGVLYVTGGGGAAQVVTISVDEGKALRVWLDGAEVEPVIGEDGDLSWPGLEFIIGEDGVATLAVKEV